MKELEELERRVTAKKRLNASSSLETQFESSLRICEENPQNTRPSLASMFLVIMSVFSILNQIHYTPTAKS